MKEIFEKIWELALPYQDKRDDSGHAATSLKYALQLVELENGDEDVIIPAIILHDVGWSQLVKERIIRFSLLDEYGSNDDVEIQIPVEAEVPDGPSIDTSPGGLKLVYYLHSPYLGRAGDGAAGEGALEQVNGCLAWL